MTYSTGNIATRGHYNIFVAGSEDGTYNTAVPNMGIVWGTGFGRYGYGQDLSFIAPVNTGDVIQAADWENLDTVISNVIDHQLGPGNYNTGSPVVPGQIIGPINRLNPGIQLAYSGVGKCFAPNQSVYNTQFSGPWGGVGKRKLRITQTLTFPTADTARWFFNAGGKLALTFDFAPNPLNLQSAVIENITQSAGTVTIGYQNTTRTGGSSYEGSYTVLPNNQGGFWGNTTGTLKQHFKQIPNPFGRYYDLDYDGVRGYYGYSGGYGYYEGPDDSLTVEMLVTDSNGINNNIGKTVKVITTLSVGEVTYAPPGNNITGLFKVNMSVSKPTTDFLPVDNWSTFIFSGQSDVLA